MDRRKLFIWIALNAAGGGGGEITTVTGVSPLLLANALAKPIHSLTQFGKCVQDGANIVCNNGVLRYGWHDIITTSQLSGYGTYVSPTPTAGNRAYRWFKDLPNGTYTFAVDGDYEIIVQWRSPADPADGYASVYENLSGWITSGEVTLDKSTGGYGIAVRRTSGTDSITPSNFDGVLHVQEQGIYTDGESEVLTVRGKNLIDINNLTPVYLAYSTPKLVTNDERYGYYIKVNPSTTYTISMDRDKSRAFLNICETASMPQNNVNVVAYNTMSATEASRTITTQVNTNYLYVYAGVSTQGIDFFKEGDFQIEAGSTATAYEPYHEPQTVTDIPNLFSTLDGSVRDEVDLISGAVIRRTEAVYEDGGIVVRALAEPVTEQGTAHSLHTASGTNIITVDANVSNIELEAKFMAASA